MKSIALTGMRRIRAGAVAGLALLALTGTVAGCSSDDEGGDGGGSGGIDGAQTESAEPDATTDAEGDGETTADTAALEQLYTDYWDAMVALENGEELDATLFDGITTVAVAEEEVIRVQTFKDNGLRREGEPTIDTVTVAVDGDTATIEACKNEDGWNVVHQGEVVPDVVPEDLLVPHAHIVTVERSDEGWLINGTRPREEATISCS
ncbi:hypothetical protein ACTWP5_04945 [Streptomyces sp. 4N509B]|uniref:hypothetical protein n=1 Tax=Streptomyces sp. 4N509B TaxID=3457413 RepID=UPI003FD58EA8